MALVGEDERVVGRYSNRVGGGWPASSSRGRSLDARAGAGRLQHLEIEQGALLEPLRLEQPPLPVELVQTLLEAQLIPSIDCSSVGRGVT